MQLLFWNRSLDTAAGKERDDLTEMPQIVENDNNGDPDVKGKDAKHGEPCSGHPGLWHALLLCWLVLGLFV